MFIRIAVTVLAVAAVAVSGYIVTVKIADYQRDQYFEVRKFQADKGSVSIEVDATGDPVLFAVRDTGRGIPERFPEDVFKKFSRLHLSTDSDERGAGLGLAISKGLVESHGGRMWVESEEGRGSTFHVEIPRG